ncbi:hypothetical protein J7E63_27055 [Bacillus sp. ISL-75]|uniref:hypothetical protein n=1 Tax=Bacillus sp. ISL-75 TaxID=2819137 RepID=UPI001BE52BA3|nr:hypothetical protein [Bacillus sp. ISL-75]MBT2730489.1 hypothetical protein [Bacillus sp. ISL-75]
MITTFMTTLLIPVATFYAIIKGVDYMFKEMSEKEKPMTVIGFQQWKDRLVWTELLRHWVKKGIQLFSLKNNFRKH